MSETNRYVFLFDVDNTLLDNDRVTAALKRFLTNEVGDERTERYWKIFEELRNSLGYADYLGSLQEYRRQFPYDSHVLSLSNFLINYPFANRLFPGSLDVIERLQHYGQVVILTDGDAVFQPRKIERSGLGEAVDNNILIYIHKEQELADIERRYPAEHYFLFDDKLRILNGIKEQWTDRVTTVFVKQGHYALDAEAIAKFPPADVEVNCISDLLDGARTLLSAGTRLRRSDKSWQS
jgi:FMN phosphatase YigB (HAD superfamily)